MRILRVLAVIACIIAIILFALSTGATANPHLVAWGLVAVAAALGFLALDPVVP
jgi:hypothetical protein